MAKNTSGSRSLYTDSFVTYPKSRKRQASEKQLQMLRREALMWTFATVAACLP